MALESCEIHYVNYLSYPYVLKRIGNQWYHGNDFFDYNLFSDKPPMSKEDNPRVKSVRLILPTRLSAYNATETETEE